MDNLSVSFIMLAYNEAENLRKILPKMRQELGKLSLKSEIIVVDSMSPLDDTKSVCEENDCKYFNQIYPGFGGALITGFQNANYDYIITLDSDGAHDPVYIAKMIDTFFDGDCDLVIGSRYVKGGRTQDPWVNILMSKMLNLTYKFMFRINANDISNNFRMYRSNDIKALHLNCENYDILQEILIKLKKLKNGSITIHEFPITLGKRISGYSKRKVIKLIISYIKTLFLLKKEYRHM